MKIINGMLVLETKPCYACDATGHPFKSGTCPQCLGSGRGKRGKPRGCTKCYGNKTVVIHERDESEICYQCKGTKILDETLFDNVPREIWTSIEIRVTRNPQKRMGFNEQYLGIGYIISTTDYGDAWRANNDEALRKRISEDKTPYCQATNLVNKETMKVIDYIEVVVNKGGYTGKGYFNDGVTPQEPLTDAQAGVLFPGYNVASLNRLVSGQ